MFIWLVGITLSSTTSSPRQRNCCCTFWRGCISRAGTGLTRSNCHSLQSTLPPVIPTVGMLLVPVTVVLTRTTSRRLLSTRTPATPTVVGMLLAMGIIAITRTVSHIASLLYKTISAIK